MQISRRDLFRRTAIGAAVTAAIASPAERTLLAAAATPGKDGRLRFPIRLDRNHNAFGPSERVAAAILDAVNAGDIDPDDEVEVLRARIADEHGVTPAHVLIGSGSTSILRMLVDAFAKGGSPIVTAAPTFNLIGDHARRNGCGVVGIPLRANGSHDLDEMSARAAALQAGLVYVCNPNNPTGTLTRAQDLEAFLATLLDSAHVVIDEAYHHYVDDASDYRSFIDRSVDNARTIVTRSFSKIHGLAGLRIGYAIARPETLARLADRQSLPAPMVAARAACAALDDVEYVRASRTRNADDRQEFFNQANARMLRWLDSQANFVMLCVNDSPDGVIAHFATNRIALPRPFPPLEQYVRVSIGTPAEMQEFWRVWDLMPHEHKM